MNIESIKKNYPLHWLVWNNDFKELQNVLKKDKYDKEQLDPRGRTPLLLAVKLCHLESVKCLLAAKCNANFEKDGWSVVQEAVCTGDESILTAILEVRDLQRHVDRATYVPKLLQYLLDAPDFYVEMKWEFTSWVPLMSRLCPSDVYKVYKRGANVRIDTTLVGFDNTTWQRGNRTYIFKEQNGKAAMIEINHDTHEVLCEELHDGIGAVAVIAPPAGAVYARLNTPVITNKIDMDKISFERNKSGIWGWRNEKVETINGYMCKVYGATNVEFVTKTRTDHLSDDQIRNKNSRSALQSFLGIAEDEYNFSDELTAYPEATKFSPTSSGTDGKADNKCVNNFIAETTITPEEYFSDEDLNGKDIGRPQKLNTKVQKFKANLWLSEQFPIRLQEQILPILDLMSTMASPHVLKLREFITMQLPAGFPVKVEIPLFHVLNACVTFGNAFGLEIPVEHVSTIQEDERLTCVIDDRCFDVPTHYSNRDHYLRRQLNIDSEEDLLQYALERSLMETGNESDQVDIWEALGRQKVNTKFFPDDETHLQKVLHESLCNFKKTANIPIPDDTVYIDTDLELAIRVSEEEEARKELEKQKEQEILEKIITLSLEEK